MQVIAKRRLRLFWEHHPRARASLEAWYTIVIKANWTGPAEIQAAFGTTVDVVGDNRMIFDIGGNKDRLIIHIAYACGRVLIEFVGTQGLRSHRPGVSIMMDVRAIRTETDYAWAIEQVEVYFDHEPAPGTPEGDRFDVLATLIEAYEAREPPVPGADPVAVLHFAIDHLGRTQTQLAELLKSRSRASEILNRQRPLTVDMIRIIGAAWHLPVESLLPAYDLNRIRPEPAHLTTPPDAPPRSAR